MVFNKLNWDNKFTFGIDNTKIDQNLIDFPIPIVLSSGTGLNNYNTTNVFTALTPSASGIDQYTSLMLHGAGDISDSRHIFQTNGNPQIVSNTPSGVGMSSSMYFDGAGDYLSFSDSVDWDLGTNSFTIDWWEYRVTTSLGESSFSLDTTGVYKGIVAGDDNSTGYLRVYMTSNGSSWDIADAKSLGTISLNQWVHLAVVRSGSNFYAFKNGAQESTWTSSSGIFYNDTGCFIGRYHTDYIVNAYIAGFRLTKGEALWTSTFSSNLPTWPYPTNSGTKLLLGFEGDTSASGHPMTFIGGTRINSSDGAFNGGYYFGAGDYVTVPDNDAFAFGGDDFTIEFWAKFSTAPGTNYWESFISQWYSTGNGDESFHCGIKSADGNVVGFSYSTTGSNAISVTTDYTVSVGVPFHYAVVRSGIHLNIYINGVSRGYNAIGTSVLHDSSRNIEIGGFQNGTFTNFNGFLSEIRISKGIARWNSDFKPPQAPFDNSWHNRKKIAITTVVSGVETELYTEIEDWFDGTYVTVYPKLYSTNTVKATSYLSTSYYPHFAVDPSLSLYGGVSTNTWRAGTGNYTNQKFNVDIGEKSVIKRIVFHNLSGDSTNFSNNGIKNFSIYGTNSATAFADTTYSGITDLTLLDSFQARQHIHMNIEDSQYFYLDNDIAYRYYILRIADYHGGSEDAMGFRHIEFQKSINEAILWTKVPTVYSGINTFLNLYYDSTQTTNSGYIGDTGETAAQNVWNSDFKAVYHMNQNPAGGSSSILDSTSSPYHGTPNGSMAINDLIHSSGTIGRGLDFDGTNDYIQNNSLYYPTNVTLYSTLNINNIGANQTIMHQGDTLIGSQQGTRFYISTTGYPYIRYYSAGSWRQVNSTIAVTNGIHDIYLSIDSTNLKCIFNIDGVNDIVAMPVALATSTYPFRIGAAKQVSVGEFFDGSMDEVRVATTPHDTAWLKATYYGNYDQLLSIVSLIFYFTNPIPEHLSTTYGTTRKLYLTVTISGEESSYSYDASFYDGTHVQIGSTVSGVSSGQPASITMSTPSGATNYYWYVTATSSGVSDISSTYQFYNRFLCEGYVEEQGVRVSGIPVRLHRRSNGEVVGNTVSSTVSGTFAIPTDYNEEHYVVALHTDTTYNALIYDRITP